jgi:hypothetical protein
MIYDSVILALSFQYPIYIGYDNMIRDSVVYIIMII